MASKSKTPITMATMTNVSSELGAVLPIVRTVLLLLAELLSLLAKVVASGVGAGVSMKAQPRAASHCSRVNGSHDAFETPLAQPIVSTTLEVLR